MHTCFVATVTSCSLLYCKFWRLCGT